MSDLSDFLLARIADDEERAKFVAMQIEGNNWQPFEPWKLSWHDEYDLLCIEPSRALAECEAKRRIVQQCGPVARGYFPCTPLAHDTLGLLALPYADHSEFREEWRP